MKCAQPSSVCSVDPQCSRNASFRTRSASFDRSAVNLTISTSAGAGLSSMPSLRSATIRLNHLACWYPLASKSATASSSLALGEYRDCRALSPVKQRRADRASAIRRMDAAGLPHLVNGIGDTAGGQDAVADHDGTVVHRDRAAGEVNPGIGELLEQVLLAQVLVLMVDGIDRAASRGRYLRSPARLWTTSGA